MRRIAKGLLAVLVSVAFASVPLANAASRFITVTLPADADLTTYGWCTPFGCDQPQRVTTPLPAAVYRAITGVAADPRRIVGMDTYGLGAWATTEAVRRLQVSPSSEPSTVAAVLLRTPTRPNGGLFTRIDEDLSTPASNFNAFGGGAPPGAVVDTSFVDVAREGDGLADFPSWFNPIAVLNATAGAALLSDYADTVTWRDPRCPAGTCTAPATWPVLLPASTGYVYAVARVPDPADPSRTIDITSPEPIGVAVIPTTGDQTVYYTQFTERLPLLVPLQRPFDHVGLVNPVVQILEPATKILVNLGYTDVDPSAGYTRTLTKPDERAPFGTLPGLTAAEWADVPRAVGRELVAGVADAVSNPFGLRDGRSEPASRRYEVDRAPAAAPEPKPAAEPASDLGNDVRSAIDRHLERRSERAQPRASERDAETPVDRTRAAESEAGSPKPLLRNLIRPTKPDAGDRSSPEP